MKLTKSTQTQRKRQGRKLTGLCLEYLPCAPYRQSIPSVLGVVAGAKGTIPRPGVLTGEITSGTKYSVLASDILLMASFSFSFDGGAVEIGVVGAETVLDRIRAIPVSLDRDMWCWSDEIENTERNKERRPFGDVTETAF